MTIKPYKIFRKYNIGSLCALLIIDPFTESLSYEKKHDTLTEYHE